MTHGENKIKLQALNERHKNVGALMVQGVGRQQIASIVGYTPEYITWLTRDPLFQQYMNEMAEFAERQLEASFTTVVEVIQDTLTQGTEEGKLKAARLQLEVTKRIGKQEILPSGDGVVQLNLLAERLLALQAGVRRGETFNHENAIEGELVEHNGAESQAGQYLQLQRSQSGGNRSEQNPV